MNNAIQHVCQCLSLKGIQILPNNEWLKACIEWFLSENSEYNTQEIQEFAFSQLLLADLNVVAQECLPTVINDAHSIKLQGKYFLQVNSFFDVAKSAYRQYQEVLKRDIPENFDEEKDSKEERNHWEKQTNRMLKMEMTDGVHVVYGMEYSFITKFNPTTMIPGIKVLLKGPVECRSGVILINETNIDILGGEVDSLYEVNHLNRLIARKLNMDENLLPINENLLETNHPLPVDQNNHIQSTTQMSNNIHVRNVSPVRNQTSKETRNVQQDIMNDDYFEDSDIFLNVPVDHLLETENDTSTSNQVSDVNSTAVFENETSEPTGNKVIEVNASVVAFRSRLLIKNDNWTLTVKLSTNEGSLKADFDPDLLDRIIGFNPVEISSKEPELIVNPTIKEKMDSMLKKSQQMIKDLHCNMTLVYNEGNELPVIIAVSDESVFCNSQ